MTTVAIHGAVPPARSDSDTFSKHVVVAGEGHAADAGREILARGGNAIDAAIATAFALAVTLPEAGNLGGGGFIVAYSSDRHEVVTVDFREMAPATATARMYLGPDGKPRPRYRAGAWSAGVPGTVRGLGLAHERFGKTAWADLFAPPHDSLARVFPSRPSWPARSIISSQRGIKNQADPLHATISADSAIFRSRSPRWASPTIPSGSPATC